ncbi:MAG: T9SS type A sorting domain-containing protein [Bacteroidota bacterium]|nr:T9SS type A sorting domain-containing protein [Bacteroidota bacterium]
MKQLILAFTFFFITIGNIVAQIQPDHVVIVILENHSFNEIQNNPSAPFINSLLTDQSTAVFTQSFANTHPSQPNYLMLFSGSDQGVVDNAVPTGIPFTTLNLGASLTQKGFTFGGFSESMPYTGYTGEVSFAYVRNHNPWVNWQGTDKNGISPALNMPFTSFPTDFTTLPTLSIVVPNLFNDMHNGSIATGDAWLQNNLGQYIQWCKSNNSLFILTFDEDDRSATNQVLTMFMGKKIQGGNYSQNINHYNLLRTIEDLYNLPYAGISADSSAIRDIWKTTTLNSPITSLVATKKNNFNLLEWTTSKEEAVLLFDIERSNDGISFSSIGKVKAARNIFEYNYTDKYPSSNINYYRIKNLKNDGSSDYSLIKTIGKKLVFDMVIYPNPVKDVLSLSFLRPLISETEIQVVDMLGRVIINKKCKWNSGAFTIDVSNLQKGNYLVKLKQQSFEQLAQFIKQ